MRLGFPKDDYKGGWEEFNEEMAAYCEQDVKVLIKLFDFIKTSLFWDIDRIEFEQNIQTIFYKMKEFGVRIKPNSIEELYKRINTDRENTLKEIPFKGNLNSHPQLREWLVGDVGFKPIDYTEKTKEPSMKRESLEKSLEAHDYDDEARRLITLVVKHAVIKKSEGNLKELANELVNGRIHANFGACPARTGRTSCRSPNLQKIPRVSKKKGWEGKYGADFRALFTHDTDFKYMCGADISSQEIVVLADLIKIITGDTYILKLVREQDIHTYNSVKLDLDDRNLAKAILYAILYGAGQYKLGTMVAPTADDGTKFSVGKRVKYLIKSNLNGFNETEYHYVAEARDKKYVTLPNGFKLFVKEHYTALNTVIQGTSAVLSKNWMLETYKRIKDKPKTHKLLLYVHDELQLQTNEPEELTQILNESLVAAVDNSGLTEKHSCDVSFGHDWSETH